MLSTKVLSTHMKGLGGLFSRVHHPPPLDKRESRRLLDALTTSFRKNLDKEHGFWSEDANSSALSTSSLADQTTTPTASTSTPSKSSSTSRDAYRRPTDRHVLAILSNPLFSYHPSKNLATQTVERDPMDVFDQAVAKGLMSPPRAAGVLVAKRQAIAQSATISVNQSMAVSGTALRVLQWLRSSGLERSLAFLEHHALVGALIPFMVEEGLEEVAWSWLERCMLMNCVAAPPKHAVHASHLLHALVRAKVSLARPLNNGYASIIRASDMFRESQYFEATAFTSWRALSLGSTVFAWQRSQPSEALFDSFAAIGEQLSKRRSSVRVDRAHLELHHPSHPDASLAIQYLNSSKVDLLRSHIDAGSPATHEGRMLRNLAKRVILMATDATAHLIRAGQESEAESLGYAMLDKFEDFIRKELGQGGFLTGGCDLVQMFRPRHIPVPG